MTPTNAFVFGFLTCALLVLAVHVWRHRPYWRLVWQDKVADQRRRMRELQQAATQLSREACLRDATEQRREELLAQWGMMRG